jgi:hypothetical protein
VKPWRLRAAHSRHRAGRRRLCCLPARRNARRAAYPFKSRPIGAVGWRPVRGLRVILRMLPIRDTDSESGERPRFSQFRHFQQPGCRRISTQVSEVRMRPPSSDRLHRRERRAHSMTANRWHRIRPDEPAINHPARLNYLLKVLQQVISADLQQEMSPQN